MLKSGSAHNIGLLPSAQAQIEKPTIFVPIAIRERHQSIHNEGSDGRSDLEHARVPPNGAAIRVDWSNCDNSIILRKRAPCDETSQSDPGTCHQGPR